MKNKKPNKTQEQEEIITLSPEMEEELSNGVEEGEE